MKLERSVIVNALVVALALGSGVALVLTREKPTSSELSARENNLIRHFPRSELRSLRVTGPGNDFGLERAQTPDAGVSGFVLSGKQGATDAEAVESFLRALELGSFLRRLDATDGAAEFGLDAPTREFSLDFGSSRAVLRLGKPALTPAESTYVAVEGDGERRLGLVRNDWLRSLPASADALRPRALLPYGLSEIESVRLAADGQVTLLTRSQGAAWQDAQGKRVRRDAVEQLVFELVALKVETFVEGATARQALEQPGTLSLSLSASAGRPSVDVRVGGRCPHDPEQLVVLRSSPSELAACAPLGLRRLFDKTLQTLADRSAFVLHADEVENVRIERDGASLEFARTERGFQLRAPSVADLSLDLGNQRIKQVLELEGEVVSAPNLAALGLAPPMGTLRLRSTAIERAPSFEEVLEIGRTAADGRVPVRRRGDGTTLLLPKDAARELSPSAVLLRPVELFEFGPSELTELVLEAGAQRQHLRRSAEGGYELLEPAGFGHDGGLVLDLVQRLGTLKAERWQADRAEPEFGLSPPTASAALTLKAGDAGVRQVALTVGAETRGGFFAALSDRPGVFVLARSAVAQLGGLLVSRSVLTLDAAALERIELVRDAEHRVLERRGGEFVATGGSLTPNAVARALETLDGLRAEAALHLGAERPEEAGPRPRLSIRLTPEPGKGKPQALNIGNAGMFRDQKVYFARVEGRPVTYVLAEHVVRDLLDSF